MRAPPTVTAKDVERVISDEFSLRAGELAVTLHHPEAFILKFKHRSHCEEAVKQGFAKARGIEVHFIQWRSLKNAAGSALMYRVKLCLDGMPMHLWAPDIAERIISRTCTLETVETDLVHPVDAGDTRVISLWAWTPNPSRIHKRVWVMITRQIRDPQLESVTISERPPEHWQRGVKHPVLFHIEEIHDYMAAGSKTTREDGRRRGDLGGRRDIRDDRRDDARRDLGGRHGDRDDRRDDARRRDRKGKYNNDHPDADRGRGWLRDEHDDEDRDNAGRDIARGRPGHRAADANFRRERTHSPRARDRDYGVNGRSDSRRYQGGTCGDKENDNNDRDDGPPPLSFSLAVSQAAMAPTQPQATPLAFLGRALPILPPLRPRRTPGIEAWSADMGEAAVLAARVFARINAAIMAATAERVIRNLLVAAGAAAAINELATVSELGSISTTPTLVPTAAPASTLNATQSVAQLAAQLEKLDISLQHEATTFTVVNDIPVGLTSDNGGMTTVPDLGTLDPVADADANDGSQMQTPAPPSPAGEGRRRSPRLAAKPLAGLPMSLRAQLNLCRRMGLTPPEGILTEKAVSDFKAMFNAPLPQDAIDALEHLFGLNKEERRQRMRRW
ncbi:hypothetical protein OsI_29554 [Oryza sativa Indica Group]|uniref:DUF4283 domain-containing protein n=1 Tax=Oryza sativa subsp. indica TaxID=39946 RepID=B8BBK7_ORYSI|nr:hypothetical protein OsI_29554 [Oryza sativa Indica Group]